MQSSIYYAQEQAQAALQLASELNVTAIEASTYQLNADVVIFFNSDNIELIVPAVSNKPFCTDFAHYAKGFSSQKLKLHPLAQAIGLKHKKLTILDATAGFGKDTALISCLGHNVIALEKNPIIFAMLKNAITKYNNPNILCINQNSCNYLTHLKPPYPDIIYLDPMFPSKTKNNLVKKPMQILQAVLADETHDEVELLAIAKQKANKKVIVKRPQTAAPLANMPADITVTKSQSTRYDVYLAEADLQP